MKFKILFMFCIVITTACFFLKLQKKSPLVVHKISAHFDQRFSIQFRIIIHNFLEEQRKISTPSSLLAKIIKDQFSVVDTVKIFTFPDRSISVSMTAQDPVVILNNAKLLTKSGDITECSFFTKEYLSTIATVTVQEEKVALTSSFRRFMSRYAQQLCKDYCVTWHDNTYIQLEDKQKRYVIVASDQTVFSQDLINHCQLLKEKVKALPGKKQAWWFDVRFKNQIILLNQKGERV
ncbi:MAG: hypothetical protein LVQ75_03165 [Candidatus Babeliales bacterium]